jgi:hypothetical protein
VCHLRSDTNDLGVLIEDASIGGFVVNLSI